MVIISILSLIALVCYIYTVIQLRKTCKNYVNLFYEYEKLKVIQMKYDCILKEKKVLEQENKQLQEELRAERQVAKSNNVKKIEDLPKTEKVTKTRTRKTTKK